MHDSRGSNDEAAVQAVPGLERGGAVSPMACCCMLARQLLCIRCRRCVDVVVYPTVMLHGFHRDAIQPAAGEAEKMAGRGGTGGGRKERKGGSVRNQPIAAPRRRDLVALLLPPTYTALRFRISLPILLLISPARHPRDVHVRVRPIRSILVHVRAVQ